MRTIYMDVHDKADESQNRIAEKFKNGSMVSPFCDKFSAYDIWNIDWPSEAPKQAQVPPAQDVCDLTQASVDSADVGIEQRNSSLAMAVFDVVILKLESDWQTAKKDLTKLGKGDIKAAGTSKPDIIQWYLKYMRRFVRLWGLFRGKEPTILMNITFAELYDLARSNLSDKDLKALTRLAKCIDGVMPDSLNTPGSKHDEIDWVERHKYLCSEASFTGGNLVQHDFYKNLAVVFAKELDRRFEHEALPKFLAYIDEDEKEDAALMCRFLNKALVEDGGFEKTMLEFVQQQLTTAWQEMIYM